jgi:Tol biopolymer transport system component
MATGAKGRRSLLVLAVIVFAAVYAPLAGAAKDDLILISRQSASDGGAAANFVSNRPSISADGRYVAFDSQADNLSSADTNGKVWPDVFVRDTQTNTTALVSRQSAFAGGAGGDEASSDPSISADGRYVTFTSGADNLSAEDNNGPANVFIRDTQANTTTLVSRQSAADGGAGADGFSQEPSISADGRYVAFASEADNLSKEDNDAFQNVFIRDTQANTTTLVSRKSAADGGDPADEFSRMPSISADGRYVAFSSQAGNLSTDDKNNEEDVFVRDMQANTTTLVSRQSVGAGGAGGDHGSSRPAISADGRYVAFTSSADNLSADDKNEDVDTFVRDMQSGITTLASRQSAADGGAVGEGGDGSDGPCLISADGRYVAFVSEADNLSTDVDSEVTSNVFVRDLETNTTTLVSRQSAADGGAGADESSGEPAISADGRYVAFESGAENLTNLDESENTDGDVFLRDVLGEPPAQQTPAPTGPPADKVAPGLGGSRAKSPQALGKPLKVRVLSDEDAAVTVTATATPQGTAKGASSSKGRAVKFKAAKAQVHAGVATTLSLKPGKAAKKKLDAAAKGKAQITITATDAAGNSAVRKLAIKLR